MYSGVDPRIVRVLGDKRFRCLFQMLKGRRCDVGVDIDVDRLLAGDGGEKEKIYGVFPELRKIRDSSGYDVVGRLVELANKIRSENVSDLYSAVVLMFSVMFGVSVDRESVEKIGGVVDVFRCIVIGEDGSLGVDYDCLDSVDVPEEFKNQFVMAVATGAAIGNLMS